MGTTDPIIIIGAGIAGAATAYFLTRNGVRDIIILEREGVAGALSTGRNAAILRSAIHDPLLREFARASSRFYRHPTEGFSPLPLLDPVGIYLIARADHSRSLLAWTLNGERYEEIKSVDPAELYDRVPILAPGVAAAVHDPNEGVLDIHSILQAFLNGARRAGAELRLKIDAIGLGINSGRVTGVETSQGFLAAGSVVMAGGGWAATLAAAAGLPTPLVPYRRHLLVTNPLPQVSPRWPVVWCYGDEFYFRPESGGLLMCACDTVPVTPGEGQQMDPAEIERIAVKAERWLPSLSDAGVSRSWAGMRTFAPDQRFVIGPDPRVHGLYWVAGLGGHGITCAPAVGQLAAEWIAKGESRHPHALELSPARLF